eukprot:m.405257 g.405257  ORF g.405257 m.405257 type:complete len:65 (-) comp16794_c3_seq51:627-821(-)
MQLLFSVESASAPIVYATPKGRGEYDTFLSASFGYRRWSTAASSSSRDVDAHPLTLPHRLSWGS